MSGQGQRRRQTLDSLGPLAGLMAGAAVGGSIAEATTILARERRAPSVVAAPTEYGNALVFPLTSFEVSETAVQSETYTAPDGFYEWHVNLINDGSFDTVLFNVLSAGSSASRFTPQQGRILALDGRSVAVIGPPEITVAIQPASYEAEEPFNVNVSVWATQLGTVASG